MATIVLCALSDRAYYRSPVYTITVKRVPFLPSYDLLVPPLALVYGHKHYTGDTRFAGYPVVSDEDYRLGYRRVIEQRLRRITAWYSALPLDNAAALTLCCYCAEGSFCHRQFVAQLFLWLNAKLGFAHMIELH